MISADSSSTRLTVLRHIQSLSTPDSLKVYFHSSTSTTVQPRDPLLDEPRSATSSDPEYAALLDAVRKGFPSRRDRTPLSIRQYWSIREQLSADDGLVFYGSRILLRFSPSERPIETTFVTPRNRPNKATRPSNGLLERHN